ncbi:YXWGXW repeat-containing protein [Mariniblastus fucicola]|uniref:Uncharacterized protein n=1 Tax=Mariniblastus fucicola TaxID=980251 RepID=A0A5B9PEY0_9BACT|nr:YXWGXW repeat-containing protein [Mariniblastus fucicola]QEG21541.1 hypothetical protein MFFC18_13980 [Mariniblastus fucicola]
MIKMTTLCPNIATVLTVSVLLVSAAFAQEPGNLIGTNSWGEVPPAIPEVPEVPEDLSILTRGPLHEAFASAHQQDPQSSDLVFKAPPELIDEVPPEYKPEGNNVQWISGYWAWDDSQSDFIWISGIWRDVPPTRRWMPGYWDSEGSGYRWVSGFWTEETQQELGYLPAPPASIDQGPSTVAPSEEYFYVPGNWQFQNNNYRWLAGHWQPVIENWIWVPARYVWTPNGCVYQSGYWDYEFENRGTCFAPVHFTQPIYRTANYSYRPSYAINLNIDFLTHMFVRPRCGHYFYGDWYGSSFNNVSYRPWVSHNSHYRNYDPLLTYYRCRRSSFDSRYNVVQYLARQHNFYIKNRDYRPRPTYKAQHKHARNIEHRHGSRGHGKDYLHKSSYVRTYKDLRKYDEQRRKQSVTNNQNGPKKNSVKKHRKVAEEELRNNRRKMEQRAELQRERKRQEHASQKHRVAKHSNGKIRLQNIPSTREREQDRLSKAKGQTRQPKSNAQRRNSQPERHTQSRGKTRTTQTVTRPSPGKKTAQQEQARRLQEQARRSLQERTRRNQQDSARKAQQEQTRRAQQEQSRRAQQDQAKRAQQEQLRRKQQESLRRAQQQNSRNTTRNTSGKMRMQNIPSVQQREQAARKAQQDSARKAQQQQQAKRAQQEQARRAQQESARRAQQAKARRAQQDAARKSQQDQARRAQQERSRQQAAQRARQQQSQRDAARRAQQKSQQDAARKAKQNKPKPPQESRSSRLRNRSSKKK